MAPGTPWTSPEGYQVALVTYRTAHRLTDDRGKQVTAMPGTDWVYVEMRFRNLAPDTGCRLLLAGPGKVQWSPASDAPLMKGTSFCTQDGAGANPTVHAVYQVPTDMLPSVRGVLLDHSMQLRQPPLFRRP